MGAGRATSALDRAGDVGMTVTYREQLRRERRNTALADAAVPALSVIPLDHGNGSRSSLGSA